MKYLYYPGCSVKSANKPYEESLMAVFDALSTGLEEVDDWNCCGATAYMAVNEEKAFALAARNFALAERQAGPVKHEGNGQGKLDMVVPCSGCYLVLYKTQKYMEEHPELKEKVQNGLKSINLEWNRHIAIRHPLDVLVNDIGYDRIQQRVKKPLKGIRVACYYGCQMIRPFEVFDSKWEPSTMEKLVESLGGEPVDWPLRTRCCGGTLIGTIHEVGLRLSWILLKEAMKRGADVLITTCPLCQINLEGYQNHMNKLYGGHIKLPIMFFTQLIGQAFDLPPKALGIQRMFVSPRHLFQPQPGGGTYVKA